MNKITWKQYWEAEQIIRDYNFQKKGHYVVQIDVKGDKINRDTFLRNLPRSVISVRTYNIIISLIDAPEGVYSRDYTLGMLDTINKSKLHSHPSCGIKSTSEIEYLMKLVGLKLK